MYMMNVCSNMMKAAWVFSMLLDTVNATPDIFITTNSFKNKD